MSIATRSIFPAVALAMGCGQSTSSQSMTSLAQSGALSVVCRDMDTGRGLDIAACPDPNATSTTGRHTLLMVTQTGRGEVAVIDMTAQSVVDEDPAAPGKEFLPIGAMPVAIASTPGGASTFVATAETGREGLFVLPTSCVTPPEVGESSRDLTQWSACRLPAAPGEMVIIPDPTSDSAGSFRKSCDAAFAATINETSRVDCPADWDAEERISPSGRRKVLVTLPKLGGVALLDARSLYGLQPGAFDACPIERWLPLSTQVPASVDQPLPDDLKATSPSSGAVHYFGPTQTAFVSRPAGISFKDGHLFVADLGVPLVHDLDWSDPCEPRELAPLTPTSLEEPNRTVLTSDVAVSDRTRDNKRFVYAVDDALGTLMAFDVSSDSQTRAPLVLPGSPYLPFSPPDRISTNLSNARARDVQFITHDVPFLSDGTTSASTRTLCNPDPNPNVSIDYRTSSDYATGASPSKLRGIFAMVALSDGHVSVIDVEDWDQPCRRPIEGNLSAEVDWRGCRKDPVTWYTETQAPDGTRTVSDEASCNVSEPHHPRSGRFFATNATVGTGAPTLSSFPALATPNGASAVAAASRANSTPKLLAVPYPLAGGVSEVQIGSTTYYLESYQNQNCTPGLQDCTNPPSGATYLSVSPSFTDQNSLILPFVEPRAYLASENFTLTYEGKLFDDRQSGLLAPGTLTLGDPDAQFCNQGVQDSAVTLQLASEYAGAGDKAIFASTHSDFVQITSDFSDTDAYWVSELGSSCASDPETGIKGINGCRSYFGINDNLKDKRELTIVEAYQDRLVLQPRDGSSVTESNLHCCFPGTAKYTVRAANQWVFRGQQSLSRISADATNRCIVDNNPRKAHLRNRALEITSSDTKCDDATNTCSCSSPNCAIGIGPSTTNSACVVSNSDPINPNANQLPSGCVFDSLKARFAVYSGTLPSIRDMAFSWQVNGGFVPYQISLTNRYTGSSVMPQSMTLAPNLGAFFVVDGVSGGVFEFVLDPFTINGNPYL